MNIFRQSDESFVELVHDEEKRAATLAAYRGWRTRSVCMTIFFSAISFVLACSSILFSLFSGQYRSTQFLFFPIIFLAVFLSRLTDTDNKIKLILCIEEMQRNKQL